MLFSKRVIPKADEYLSAGSTVLFHRLVMGLAVASVGLVGLAFLAIGLQWIPMTFLVITILSIALILGTKIYASVNFLKFIRSKNFSESLLMLCANVALCALLVSAWAIVSVPLLPGSALIGAVVAGGLALLYALHVIRGVSNLRKDPLLKQKIPDNLVFPDGQESSSYTPPLPQPLPSAADPASSAQKLTSYEP